MKSINITAATIAVSLVCAQPLAEQSVRTPATYSKQHSKSSGETSKQLLGDERATQWPDRLRVLREELEKPVHDNNKLAMLFANLSVAVHDQQTIDETLKMFEQAESETKLPADARPYFAHLLFERYESYPRESTDEASLRLSAERMLSPALSLFLRAYSEEASKNTIDQRKLRDIALGVVKTYQSLGRGDEADRWLQSLLSVSTLPESLRAEMAYALAQRFWEKSYQLTIQYSNKNQRMPDADVSRIRDWLNQADSNIHTTHSLEPKHADSWALERLIALEEAAIEKNAEQKRALQRKASEAEDRFTALINGQRRTGTPGERDSRDDARPYASGFPSLSFSSITIIAPPPPPPSPLTLPHRRPGKKP